MNNLVKDLLQLQNEEVAIIDGVLRCCLDHMPFHFSAF